MAVPPIPPNPVLSFPRNSPIRLCDLGNSYALPEFTAGAGGYPVSNTTGLGVQLEAMTFGKFKMNYGLAFGVNGETSTQILARYSTQVAPNYSKFDALLLFGLFINDVTAISAATSIANLDAMCRPTLNAGKIVILTTPYPPSLFNSPTTAQKEKMALANGMAKAYAQVNPGVIYVDLWRAWVDATLTTGAAAPNVLWDGRHGSFYGVNLAAQCVTNACGPLFPFAPKTQAQWDAYDATNNPYGNMLAYINAGAGPQFQGTGGALAGATGVLATGYNLLKFGGTDAATSVVASKVAATNGINSSGGDKQRIICNITTSWFGAMTSSKPTSPNYATGTLVEALIEVTFTGLTNMNCQLYCYQDNGTLSNYAEAMNSGDNFGYVPWPDGTYLFRTPPMAQQASYPNWHFEFAFGGGALSSGTIDLAAPVIRAVQ